MSTAYFALGSVYIYLNEFNKSIVYHRKAASLGGLNKFSDNVYYKEHLGQCFLGLNKPDSAFFYIKQVLDYQKQNKMEEGFDVYLMGSVYYQKGDYNTALLYYKEALQIEANDTKFYKNIADYNIGISNVYQKKNLFDSAILYAKNALDIANGNGLPNERLDALNLLTTQFDSKLMIDSAYKYQKYANALKDSVNNSDKIRAVQLVSFDDELNRQQQADQQKKRINTIVIFSLTGALLSSLVIALIIFRNNKQRKKAYGLLQRQKQEIDNQKAKVERTFEDLKIHNHN